MLIVRGQAKLLEDVTAVTDLEHIRALFEALEKKEALLRLIDAADGAEGVQIFIGTDNELFTLAGCSMIIAPFSNRREQGRKSSGEGKSVSGRVDPGGRRKNKKKN